MVGIARKNENSVAAVRDIPNNNPPIIVDPEREFVYTADQVVSKSRNTPFLGWRLKGRAVLTMVGGEVRYRLPG